MKGLISKAMAALCWARWSPAWAAYGLPGPGGPVLSDALQLDGAQRGQRGHGPAGAKRARARPDHLELLLRAGLGQADDGRPGTAGLPGPPPALPGHGLVPADGPGCGLRPDRPEKMVENRQTLDGKRIAAVQAYLTAQTAGRPTQFQVFVHDPAEPSLSSVPVNFSVIQMYFRFRGGLMMGGGGSNTRAAAAAAAAAAAWVWAWAATWAAPAAPTSPAAARRHRHRHRPIIRCDRPYDRMSNASAREGSCRILPGRFACQSRQTLHRKPIVAQRCENSDERHDDALLQTVLPGRSALLAMTPPAVRQTPERAGSSHRRARPVRLAGPCCWPRAGASADGFPAAEAARASCNSAS